MMKPSYGSLKAFSVMLGLTALSSARKCQELMVEVPVEARIAVFDLEAPASDIEVTNFALDLTRQGHNLTAELLLGVSSPDPATGLMPGICQLHGTLGPQADK